MTRRIIGLTGGIACGKSTVSDYLRDVRKIPVLDADLYAREAVREGSAILEDIFARYGDRVKKDDGSLDRKKLGEIIFNDGKEKIWLEGKIHPYVRECFRRDSASLEGDSVVYSIPLLFEADLTGLAGEIWVVSCPREEQIGRLTRRDNLTREGAIVRINNQMPLEEKIARADVVIENDRDLVHLYEQIDRSLNRG